MMSQLPPPSHSPSPKKKERKTEHKTNLELRNTFIHSHPALGAIFKSYAMT